MAWVRFPEPIWYHTTSCNSVPGNPNTLFLPSWALQANTHKTFLVCSMNPQYFKNKAQTPRPYFFRLFLWLVLAETQWFQPASLPQPTPCLCPWSTTLMLTICNLRHSHSSQNKSLSYFLKDSKDEQGTGPNKRGRTGPWLCSFQSNLAFEAHLKSSVSRKFYRIHQEAFLLTP